MRRRQLHACSAALRFVDWVEPLLRRESYLALLVERPEVHHRLLRLLGLARWPMQYLMRHPGVIDELADERLLHQRFDRAAFSAELEDRAARPGSAPARTTRRTLLDTLRHAHHAEVFRTLVRDVEGDLTVEQVADDLSALADAVLDIAAALGLGAAGSATATTPGLAVIAYGKLGGKELGYGSDLDVVFLYDDSRRARRREAARQEVYAAFVRKLITWLTLRTAAGELFDIDTALRPNGNSGLLVTSIDAFETLPERPRQQHRLDLGAPGPDAGALRAPARRPSRPRFDATRRAVLTAPRDAAALREEVRAMREKVRGARPVPAGRFDVKHSAGGMMDVEFAVQYLVLAHGRGASGAAGQRRQHRAAAARRGRRPAARGRGPRPRPTPTANCAAPSTARGWTSSPRSSTPTRLAGPRDAVLALWQAVFG